MSGQKTLTIFNPNSTPFGGQKSQQLDSQELSKGPF